MPKPCILISGNTLAADKDLQRDLRKGGLVLINREKHGIESILRQQHVDLLLLEVAANRPTEVEIIRRIKKQHPAVAILVIDGNGDHDVLIKAFAYGAKDGFRKPYERKLVVERIQAILKYLQK
jgi:DNA-binding response OmpR family regulator